MSYNASKDTFFVDKCFLSKYGATNFISKIPNEILESQSVKLIDAAEIYLFAIVVDGSTEIINE